MTKYLHYETKEEVEPERWQWQAHYNDGTVLKQFETLSEELGVFHSFYEIDQSRLHAFKMKNASGNTHTLVFTPGEMKLIHKYRVSGVLLGDKKVENRFYLFGYEKKTGDKLLIFITPNDEFVITDDDQKVDLSPKMEGTN